MTAQELTADLNTLSEFMNSVICEIMLQDVEALLDRYLKKTRKVSARTPWLDH
jgi:hypothetical protein